MTNSIFSSTSNERQVSETFKHELFKRADRRIKVHGQWFSASRGRRKGICAAETEVDKGAHDGGARPGRCVWAGACHHPQGIV